MCPQLPPPDVELTVQATAAVQVVTPASDAIECLPDLPMLTIFSHIPLFDLLTTIPQVSPRLAELRAEACRRRHSLTLLLGDGAEHDLDQVTDMFSTLPPIDPLSMMVFREKHLVPSATLKLTRSLPNITSLTVVLNRKGKKEELWEVIALLYAWVDQLTDLVLVFGYPTLPSDIFSLQPFINRLVHLRHLTLFMIGWDEPVPENSPPFDFPVMTHLETFNCCFDDAPRLFVPSMARYFADNQRARSIDFGSGENEDLDGLFTLPPSVGRLFTRLGNSIWGWQPDQLQGLCLTFQCLTSIKVDLLFSPWPGLHRSLPYVASRLVSLTCLTELRLEIDDLARIEEVPLPADTFITALPTVTFLTLILNEPLISHEDLVPLHLEKMLPNLKRFLHNGDFHGCYVCDYEDNENLVVAERMVPRVACAQAVLAPIRPLFGRLELTQVGFKLLDDKPTIVTLP